MGQEARGSVIGYPTQVLMIRDPQLGPHSDRQTDKTLQVKSDDLYFLEPLSGVRSKHIQGEHSEAVVVLSALLTPRLGPLPTPHPPTKGRVRLPVTILTQVRRQKEEGGEPWAWRHPKSKGSRCAGRAGFGMWATSGLCLPDHPP